MPPCFDMLLPDQVRRMACNLKMPLCLKVRSCNAVTCGTVCLSKDVEGQSAESLVCNLGFVPWEGSLDET